ncbi:MAG: hypothetical protein NXH75_14475 [Halobacteriovoraceae bacterium]|nr:hypothetical protein [Halobacteriovoraceae bacterium]
MKALIFSFLFFATGTQAQTIVGKDTVKAQMSVSQEVEVLFVETMDACILTYDPQWADEEDTRGAEVVFDNYVGTSKLIHALSRKGFTFYGYKDSEKCEVESNTFPKVLTSTGSEYFARFVSRSTMAKAAKAQNAFKKVTRIYIKGLKEFDKKAKAAVHAETSSIIKSLK